jgi:hypothetical protein
LNAFIINLAKPLIERAETKKMFQHAASQAREMMEQQRQEMLDTLVSSI